MQGAGRPQKHFTPVDRGITTHNKETILNPGAGPRWLAEARHESAFRHWETAAAATSVQHQTPELHQRRSGGSWRGVPRRLNYVVLSSMQKQTAKRLEPGFKNHS